jgi:hypothetical protein
MPKKLLNFGMANKLIEVVRHLSNITAISGRVQGIITGVSLLPYLGLGAIIMFLSKTASNEKVDNITLCNFSSCICLHYRSMNGTSIGNCGMYINYKHLHYIFQYLCKLDYKKYTFIHVPPLSWDEIKQVFVVAGTSKHVNEQVS